MWVFYFVSRTRIAQLAAQINPNIPIEQVKKYELKGTAEGKLKAKTSKLMTALGLSGEASGGAEGEISRTTEEKYKAADDLILDTVCNHLMDRGKHSFLNTEAKKRSLKELKPLIRFRGFFRPVVEGTNVAERTASYEEMKSICWDGYCGSVRVSFTTTKESIESPTPIWECLRRAPDPVLLEGFGTWLKTECKGQVVLLPLFIGLDLESDEC